MNAHSQNLEIEIKLRLESFTEYLKLLGFLGSPDRELHQINCFFDSEDNTLHKAGWVIRVRAEDDRGLVTLKGTDSEEHELAVMREEVEAVIGRGEAMSIINLERDILSLDAEPVRFVRKNWPGLALSRQVQFSNTRQLKNYKIGDYSYVLELDRTEYADGTVDYELEMELDQPERTEVVIPSLQKLFASLDIPFERQEQTKLERALLRSRRF